MKILKPVNKVKPPKHHGKYLTIWNAVNSLRDGKWLPIECDSTKEIRLLQISANTNRPGRYESFREGTTLFLRKKA